MTTRPRQEPHLARQALEGIGIAALGTALVAGVGWGLAVLVNWIL